MNAGRREVAEFIARSRNPVASRPTDGAYEESDNAVKLAARTSRALYTKGRAELSRPNYTAAIASFSKAVKLNPSNAWAWNNLGYAELMLGRYEAAAEHLAEATKHNTKTDYIFNNLGLALEQLDRLDEARSAFATAAKLGSKKAAASHRRLEGVKTIRTPARQESNELPPVVKATSDRSAPPLQDQKGGSPERALEAPASTIDKPTQPADAPLSDAQRAYQAHIAKANQKKSVLELAHEEQANWLKETQHSSNIISILWRSLRGLWNPDADDAPVGEPPHDHGSHSHGPDDHSHGPDDHEHGHDDHGHDHGDHEHGHDPSQGMR